MAEAELAKFQGEETIQPQTHKAPQSDNNPYNPNAFAVAAHGPNASNEQAQDDANPNNTNENYINKKLHKVTQNTMIIFLFYLFSSFSYWIGVDDYYENDNDHDVEYEIYPRAFVISHTMFCVALFIIIRDWSYKINPETFNRVQENRSVYQFIGSIIFIGSIAHIIGMVYYYKSRGSIWDDNYDDDDDDNDDGNDVDNDDLGTTKLLFWGCNLPILLWNWYFGAQYLIIKKRLFIHLLRLIFSGFILFVNCILFLPFFIARAVDYYEYDYERYAAQWIAMSCGIGLIAFCTILLMITSLGLMCQKIDNSLTNKNKIVWVVNLIPKLICASFIVYFVSFSCALGYHVYYNFVQYILPFMFGCVVIVYDIQSVTPRQIVG